MKFFATFVSGTQDIINQRLNKFANNELKVLQLYDGIVVFESTFTQAVLSELRFFHNVYELLAEFDSLQVSNPQALPVPRINGSFTVRFFQQNQPAPLPDSIKQYIINASGGTFTAHRPDSVFTLLERRDGRVFWGRMLPRAGFKRRSIETGELRPELAHILGLVAGLGAKDTVLDPFAGYGGIVRECLQGFHVQRAIAIEQNERLVPHLKSIPRLVALHGDARQMAHIETRSIDRIVTDPPWGEFNGQPSAALQAVYRHAFVQMHRVLRTKGAAVVLTAVPFLTSIAAETAFDVVKEYPILVNGHKATIFKLRKIGS